MHEENTGVSFTLLCRDEKQWLTTTNEPLFLNMFSLLQMPSTTNVPFWRKYFTVEVVVFFMPMGS